MGNLDAALGLRPEPRESEDKRFRARLKIMLNAFGLSKLKARFKANLVCCWASMLNISYDYRKEDPFPVALQKVMATIRDRGVKLYNFQSNVEGACEEVDVSFLDYASEHRQCNSVAKSVFPGAPVFTGRTDTAQHLLSSVASPASMFLSGNGIELRPVTGAVLESVSSLNCNTTLSQLSKNIEPCVIGGT
jgi:hypothetical protein